MADLAKAIIGCIVLFFGTAIVVASSRRNTGSAGMRVSGITVGFILMAVSLMTLSMGIKRVDEPFVMPILVIGSVATGAAVGLLWGSMIGHARG